MTSAANLRIPKLAEIKFYDFFEILST